MGKRLVITVEALLRANCTLVQKIIHHPASEARASQPFEEWNEHLLKITFPGGVVSLMDFYAHEDRVWVETDYSERGATLEFVSPVLAALNIPHLIQ